MTTPDDLTFAPDVSRAMAFFRKQARYTRSPVREVQLDGMTLLAKDETGRMGLGAFKALGAPYAVWRLLEQAWQAESGAAMPADPSTDSDFQAFAARQVFVCASAGNHGLGVASGAARLGAQARIHLAETVPAAFAERLRALGAAVVRSGAVYDDSVAAASEDAAQSGAILLADGTWPGYTEIPKLVMEGYCVIAEELRERFEQTGDWPSHVYLQAGVGGLAAAMAHMIRLNWAEQPELIVVEPEAAPCLQNSHAAGRPTRGDGPDSVMGRLDCKEPSIVAWQVLESCNVRYAALSEKESQHAAEALSTLICPTTPSGAAGYGAFVQDPPKGTAGRPVRALVVISEGQS